MHIVAEMRRSDAWSAKRLIAKDFATGAAPARQHDGHGHGFERALIENDEFRGDIAAAAPLG